MDFTSECLLLFLQVFDQNHDTRVHFCRPDQLPDSFFDRVSSFLFRVEVLDSRTLLRLV